MPDSPTLPILAAPGPHRPLFDAARSGAPPGDPGEDEPARTAEIRLVAGFLPRAVPRGGIAGSRRRQNSYENIRDE
ncbi:MAG: hypothetical protein Fur0037_00990 [Planctomycetota bacterium]